MSRFPGPKAAGLLDELQQYVITSARPFAVDLAGCDGMWLATLDGPRLFDWTGLYGSRLLGYNHPALAEPEYVRRLVLAANNKLANPDFLTPECLAYYRLVHSLAPAMMKASGRLEVYVVNSGAEAVENLMKYFLTLHRERLAAQGKPLPERRRFLHFEQGFHGRTVFALSVTELAADPVLTRGFRGLVPGNLQVPFPAVDVDAPEATTRAMVTEHLELVDDCLGKHGEEIVGIIVEPIQGAGGHRVSTTEFFQGLSRLARKHGVYLGFDEVQTAGGQTGTVFACEQFDLPYPPQAIATAKKLGNGVIYMLHPMEDHGVLDSTWGGNLADMVRFTREWQVVVDEQLIESVPARAAHLVAMLRGLAARFPGRVRNIRGLGLYQGFTLPSPEARAALVKRALEEESMLLLGAGFDTIRLRPNLAVTVAEIDDLGARLERLLGGLP